jgi:hypothetical protein
MGSIPGSTLSSLTMDGDEGSMNVAFIASVTGMITALNAAGSAWRMTIERVIPRTLFMDRIQCLLEVFARSFRPIEVRSSTESV